MSLPLKALIHGVGLAFCMLLASAVWLGVLQFFPITAAMFFSIPLMILAGFVARRKLWPRPAMAGGVVIVGLLCFMSAVGLVGMFGNQPVNVGNIFHGVYELMLGFYGPFYWLPFIIGIAAGGLWRDDTLRGSQPAKLS